MKTMVRFPLALIALASAFSLLSAQSPRPSPSASPTPAPITVSKDGFTFSLVIVGERAEVSMSAKTSGWVAVGFDPVQRMKGANYVLGFVKDGKGQVRDDYGSGPVSHASDLSAGGTDDAVLLDAWEKDGVTFIRFSIPREAKHPTDLSLDKGKHRVIMAAGPRDDFSSMHAARTAFDIDIP